MLTGIAWALISAPISAPVLDRSGMIQSPVAGAFSGRQHALQGGQRPIGRINAAAVRSAEPSLSRPLIGFSSARTVLADGYRPCAEPSIIWASELDDNTAANPSCAHDSSTPIVRRESSGCAWQKGANGRC